MSSDRNFSYFRAMKVSRNYLLLHLMVLIFGFTGIIGAVISIDPVRMVWLRTIIAAVIIAAYAMLRKHDLKTDFESGLQLIGTGFIIAFHWVCFYGAIKASNVSVTLACFASGSFFAALLEPLFYRRRIDGKELFFGILVMAGVGVIFSLDTSYTKGIVLGLLAALTAAIFTIINGAMVKKVNSSAVSAYEMTGGFIGISLYLLFSGQLNSKLFVISANDWYLLLVLAVFCTAFTFVLGVEIMKEISAYTVVLTVNLEPIYGMILAYLILNEGDQLNGRFYLGAMIILAAVFLNVWVKRKINIAEAIS